MVIAAILQIIAILCLMAIIYDNKKKIQDVLEGLFVAVIVLLLIIGGIIAITC